MPAPARRSGPTRLWRSGLSATAGLAAGAALACPLTPADGERLAAGPVQLAWQPAQGEAAALASGRPFALQLRLCPADATLQRVDATMPEHRHGMNYRPSVQPTGPAGEGRWRAEGLLLHMGGRWELRFDVAHGGQVHTLRRSVEVR